MDDYRFLYFNRDFYRSFLGFAQEKVRELHHKHEINVIGEGVLAQIIRNTIRW